MQIAKCKSQDEEERKATAAEGQSEGRQAASRDLSERLLAFAVRIGKVVNALPATRLGRHLANQLVQSETSPAPNYEEGRAAESRADFVHKLRICLKELRESRFWIRLIVESGLLPKQQMADIDDESDQLYY